jgi:hypothetical protein
MSPLEKATSLLENAWWWYWKVFRAGIDEWLVRVGPLLVVRMAIGYGQRPAGLVLWTDDPICFTPSPVAEVKPRPSPRFCKRTTQTA